MPRLPGLQEKVRVAEIFGTIAVDFRAWADNEREWMGQWMPQLPFGECGAGIARAYRQGLQIPYARTVASMEQSDGRWNDTHDVGRNKWRAISTICCHNGCVADQMVEKWLSKGSIDDVTAMAKPLLAATWDAGTHLLGLGYRLALNTEHRAIECVGYQQYISRHLPAVLDDDRATSEAWDTFVWDSLTHYDATDCMAIKEADLQMWYGSTLTGDTAQRGDGAALRASRNWQKLPSG